jgi:hypothetical protein
MRLFISLLLLIVLGWMGYWAVGAIALDRTLSGWLRARESEGWVANYASIDVDGFPSRFEARLTDLELADPRTGVAWKTPEFRFDAASARPTSITAFWPDTQSIASPNERIAVTSETMRGTVTFAPNTALALRSSDIELANIGLVSTLGWTSGLDTGRLITTQSDRGDFAHDIDFNASSLRLAEPVKSALDPAGVLPAEISLMRVIATVDFDAPWDRFAIERARPQITEIDLEDLRATWGNLDVRAAGSVTVDAEGIPTGSVTIKATNWREMLDIAEAAGVIPEQIRPTIERALEILATLSGPSDTLDAPLSFERGFVSFGPIPLGRAPRLVIR